MKLDDLPAICGSVPKMFQSELDLCRTLHEEDSFWVSLGCCPNPCFRTHTSPDFLAKVNDKKNNNERFGVEVEITPRNFTRHGHDAYNVHVIVSLWSHWWITELRKIPIISIYRKCGDGYYRKSLESDIARIYGNGSRVVDWGKYAEE